MELLFSMKWENLLQDTQPITHTTRGGRRACHPKTTLPHRPPGPLATVAACSLLGGRHGGRRSIFLFLLCLFENKPTPSFLSSKKPPAAIHTGASDPIHRPAHTLSLSLQPSVTPLAACRQSLFARSSRACRACLPRPAARGGASSPGGRTGLRSSGGSHGRCRLPRRRSRRTACM